MRKVYLLAACAFLFLAANAGAQQRYALIIGNGAYNHITRLANPVNDATDMGEALRNVGFEVDMVINGSLGKMEAAVVRLKNYLSRDPDSYGFFYYAGHGVQVDGENFLIPVDAEVISESFLRSKALNVQAVLDELNEAKNSLNIVVLDACRNNPFAWSRSLSRGLVVVNNQPADSIIIYAAAAGKTASDGSGRNGLFTKELLRNIQTPDIDVKEVFDRTGVAVAKASEGMQRPAIYSMFYGTAYLTRSGNAPKADYETTPLPSNTPDSNPVVTPTANRQTVTTDIRGWKPPEIRSGKPKTAPAQAAPSPQPVAPAQPAPSAQPVPRNVTPQTQERPAAAPASRPTPAKAAPQTRPASKPESKPDPRQRQEPRPEVKPHPKPAPARKPPEPSKPQPQFKEKMPSPEKPEVKNNAPPPKADNDEDELLKKRRQQERERARREPKAD